MQVTGDSVPTMPTDSKLWLDYLLGPQGLVVGLLFILYAAFKDKPFVVSGSMYREMKADRDRWMDAAVTNTRLAQGSVKVTQEAVATVRETTSPPTVRSEWTRGQ